MGKNARRDTTALTAVRMTLQKLVSARLLESDMTVSRAIARIEAMELVAQKTDDEPIDADDVNRVLGP